MALAVVYRLGSQDTDQQDWVANTLLDGLVVTTLLPLTALVFGTAALGAEIEDGTAVYLLAKPVPRSRIILGKLLAAWAAHHGDGAGFGARGRCDRPLRSARRRVLLGLRRRRSSSARSCTARSS